MGNSIPKDGTAQGVAKVRHYESLYTPEQRLYHDPYAYAMFPGSIGQKWMGVNMIDSIYRWLGLIGFSEMITIRTKWLDDNILNTIKDTKVKQLIILGAGYDTRGFRLDLPNDFKTLEVDQPEVQTKKLVNLKWLVDKSGNDSAQKTITERMESKRVEFVPVDFNTNSLEEKLKSHDGFQDNQLSVVTLEGVTQYIPKESTADTLKKLKNMLAPGSTLLISYVDQKCFDDPDIVPLQYKRITSISAKVGEPWISGWVKEEFETFLKDCGYQVTSDTCAEDYNKKYLQTKGRKYEGEMDLLSLERLVVAKVL